MGGVVIEAHVHGLPTPNVKFYRDNHLLHARKNKIVFFIEKINSNKEIFQCLMVRPDASVSGTYTVLAENSYGKRRFDHHVDFETKYPFMNLPLIRHADKKLDDFIEEMLEKVPKHPAAVEEKIEAPVEEEKLLEEVPKIEEKLEVIQPPKPEEIAEALQAVVDEVEGKPVEEKVEKPKKKSKSRHHHHHKKRKAVPEIDADLLNDGEDEEEVDDEPGVLSKRKFSTVIHEPYEPETFRIYNTKQNLWFSGQLRDQTAIEGSTIKLFCTVSGPLPIMKWLKNGKPVPWGQTVRNMSGEGIGQVIIERISRSDAGAYVCVARNAFNEVETTSNVKVIPKYTVPVDDSMKPMFTRILGQFYRIAEDDLILDTHVRGVPKPTIKWYKDGNELTKAIDDRYDVTTDHDGGYQFRIHKPVASDSALYACEAINDVGKYKISCKVEFSQKDKHTHPQFVYHKESMWQPTLRMSIEPEPVIEKDEGVFEMPIIDEAAGQSANDNVKIQANHDNSGNDQSEQSGGDGGASNGGQQNGSSGGDGNEEGDENKDIPNSTSDAPDDEEKEEEGEKKKKKTHRPRRRRYEDPVEPLLIRDSVSKFFTFEFKIYLTIFFRLKKFHLL